MKRVRCLIVDDERLARQHLRRLLESRGDIEIVGEASNKAGAVRAVAKREPDLLLLDIQMPGGDGFDILNALEEPPHVIFVTAYDKHALRAFEVNALDYLLKPVNPERFNRAIDRALSLLRGGPELQKSASPRLGVEDMALVQIGGSGHFVGADEILSVESEGNYTRVTTCDGKHLTARQTMKQWSDRLPVETFVQLDRGIILNSAGVVAANFAGRTAEVTMGKKRIKLRLGAAAAARLRAVLAG